MTSGAMAASLGADNPFRYRGYYYDNETGLYYLNARYYNPQWGRFINADSYGGSTGQLLSHNVFIYCSNNPVMMSDPSGNRAIIGEDSGGRVIYEQSSFATLNAAARYWAKVHGAESIKAKVEHSGLIYKKGNRYELGETRTNNKPGNVTPPTPIPGREVAAYIHSHGAFASEANVVFSIKREGDEFIWDIPNSYDRYKKYGAVSYLSTPNGWLQKLTWSPEHNFEVELISAGMLHDTNCPDKYLSVGFWGEASSYYDQVNGIY